MEFPSTSNEQQKYNNQNCEAPDRNPKHFFIKKPHLCGESIRYIFYQIPLNGLPPFLKISLYISESKYTNIFTVFVLTIYFQMSKRQVCLHLPEGNYSTN